MPYYSYRPSPTKVSSHFERESNCLNYKNILYKKIISHRHKRTLLLCLIKSLFLYKLLYNIYVKTTFDIFSSKARGRILRTLYFQHNPTPLRHVALISDLPVYSVQKALDSLLTEAIVCRHEKGNNVLFELNKHHPLYAILEQLFITEMKTRLRINAEKLHQKARQSLKFANTTKTLLRHPRKTKEDIIISKLYSLRNDLTRFNDMDDIKSILKAQPDMDQAYICGQMQKLQLTVPDSLKEIVPKPMLLTSKRVRRELRQPKK